MPFNTFYAIISRYKFPNLSEPAKYDKHEFEYEKDSNCRRMFLQLFNDKPVDSNKPVITDINLKKNIL